MAFFADAHTDLKSVKRGFISADAYDCAPQTRLRSAKKKTPSIAYQPVGASRRRFPHPRQRRTIGAPSQRDGGAPQTRRRRARRNPQDPNCVPTACKEPSDSVKESQRALSIPFRPIMRSAQHFAIGFVRIAAFAPCGNMIGVHFVKAIDSGLIAIVACGADRAV